MDATQLYTLISRMKKIGIEIELSSNIPWIYLHKVNGNRVKQEDFYLADHGFTIAWYPVKPSDRVELTDITEIFKIIRKYK